MSGRNAPRQCQGCGARLASDNRENLCAPCVRRDVHAFRAPAKPAEFWDRPRLRKALRSRHFGHVIEAYRKEHDPVLTQAKIGRWFGLTQGQISRLERSVEPLQDLSKLEQWAQALRIPEALLWFRFTEHDVQPASEMSTGNGFGWFSAPSPEIVERIVCTADVETLRAMTRTFRQLDNRFGGGHARATVSHYLVGEAVPLLRAGRFREGVRRELFGAVAELNQLAGWMAYDVGDASAGRKHLRQALQLCQDVGDDALAAEMLAGMSHHAAFVRSPLVAVDLARAARDNAGRTGISALMAESAVMEAHGLALRRDAKGCLAALRDAEASFSSAGSDVPEWLRYFDAAYMAAKFAHCFRDLGRSDEAERFARRSLEMTEGYDRGRLFNTALLASILADQRRVEEACAAGTSALRMAGNMHSVRTLAYLKDVARRLQPFHAEPAVQALYAEMAAVGIELSERQDVQ